VGTLGFSSVTFREPIVNPPLNVPAPRGGLQMVGNTDGSADCCVSDRSVIRLLTVFGEASFIVVDDFLRLRKV
jgi:hypothetical protein